MALSHRLNIKLNLQSLYGLHVHSCTYWLRPHSPPPPLGLIGAIGLFVTPCPLQCMHSANHRVHTEWQLPLSGVHSIMMEKLAQPGYAEGVHAHPLSLYLPSRTKLWCTLQLRGQIHSSYFYSTSVCVCTPWCESCSKKIEKLSNFSMKRVGERNLKLLKM
jgi:hypothetical protein